MNLLETYNNYLHAIDYEEQYGNKYGDSEALRIYEKMLQEHHIRIIKKDGTTDEEEKVKVKKL